MLSRQRLTAGNPSVAGLYLRSKTMPLIIARSWKTDSEEILGSTMTIIQKVLWTPTMYRSYIISHIADMSRAFAWSFVAAITITWLNDLMNSEEMSY